MTLRDFPLYMEGPVAALKVFGKGLANVLGQVFHNVLLLPDAVDEVEELTGQFYALADIAGELVHG